MRTQGRLDIGCDGKKGMCTLSLTQGNIYHTGPIMAANRTELHVTLDLRLLSELAEQLRSHVRKPLGSAHFSLGVGVSVRSPDSIMTVSMMAC